MSIATTDNKITYMGNGATYTRPFSFPVLETSHMQIILTDSGGTETRMKNIACDWLVYAVSPTVAIV